MTSSYPCIETPSRGDRILIVAPHIDDEIIGAGGYALGALDRGAEVYVVFLTAGDCSRVAAHILHRTLDLNAGHYLSVGRTRIAEAKQAMRQLGLDDTHYFILGYPDRGLRALLDHRDGVIPSASTGRSAVPYEEALSPGAAYRFTNLMADMERIFEVARPTTVIAPVSFDLHSDHSAAAELTELALIRRVEQPAQLGYLIHSSRLPKTIFRSAARALVPPSRLRTLSWGTYALTSAVQQRKENLLQTYKSQGPYVSLLRNAFVRPNELFFLGPHTLVVPPHALTTAVRIAIAR